MGALKVRHCLAEALGVADAANTQLETVDVAGAAALLHTTPRAIYVRAQRGQMPKPITRRPLVWRKADLLNRGR
jgi:hypothetical protein